MLAKMPPAPAINSREAAVALVEAYGKAWTGQDPDGLAALFTDAAVYVRARHAVFTARHATIARRQAAPH